MRLGARKMKINLFMRSLHSVMKEFLCCTATAAAESTSFVSRSCKKMMMQWKPPCVCVSVCVC